MFILRNKFDKITNIGCSKLIFYVFLFFLPLGTRKAFFGDQSFIFGYHIFYNTIFLYATDFLFVLLLVTWTFESAKNWVFYKTTIKQILDNRIYQCLAIFWLISAISVLFSHEIRLGLYELARITQGMLFFFYISQKINISREIKWIFSILIASLSLESLLGIFQYIFQSSFNMLVFGEEFLRRGMWGVAQFASRETFNPVIYNFLPYLRENSDISVVLRAYGTLPHPNVLSGLLFTGLIMNIWLIYSRSKTFSHEILSSLSLILISTGLVVTFSRVTWLVTGLAIFCWLLFLLIKIRKPYILAMKTGRLNPDNATYKPRRVAVIMSALLSALFLNIFLFREPIMARVFDKGGSNDYFKQESVTERKTFNSISREMITKNPIFGVGMKNYVIEIDKYNRGDGLLPQLHQPVHNIYLLIAAESGSFALLALIFAIYYIVRPYFTSIGIGASRGRPLNTFNFTLLIIFAGFVIIGLFDHYLWTIQQGSLTFWTVLGLLANKKMEA